jgi:hypothetical protein
LALPAASARILGARFIVTSKNLLLALASALLMLALTEGVLRVVDFPPSPPVGWRWDESPYRGQYDTRINQLGLRGDPIRYDQDDYVVLLLGDSQVEAGTQPHEKMPEVLLRQALGQRLGSRHIKVFSVASAGWGTDQQLVWLNKYFESYRADLVVNWLTPVNDYWENTYIDRGVTPQAGRLKPTYRLDGQDTLRLAGPAARWKLRDLASLAIGRARNGSSYTLEQHRLDGWLATLPSPQSTPRVESACPAEQVDQKVLISSYMQGRRAYTLVTDEDLGHGRSHFAVFLKPESARDRYAIEITHRLLGEVSRSAKAHGARFLIYHAYRHDLDAAFAEIRCVQTADGQRFGFDGSDWLRHLKLPPLAGQLVTARISADHALNAGPNDWHFNEEGNRKAMAALADLLAAHIAPPAPVSRP